MVVRDGSVLMGLRSGDKVKASSDLNGEDTWTMPGELSQISEAAEKGTATVVLDKEAVAAAETVPGMPAALDFDLDLGAPPAAPSSASILTRAV